MQAYLKSQTSPAQHNEVRAICSENDSATVATIEYGQPQPCPVDPLTWPKRILLVDDDPGIRETLGRVLESEDYAIATARTGREAVLEFVTRPPDLVLLDLNMPDRDGWHTFRLMNVAHPLLPIIVITARPNQYPQAVERSVDALMEKPLNLPLLLKVIRNFLAETEDQRMRRLTDPDFRPILLNSPTTTLQADPNA